MIIFALFNLFDLWHAKISKLTFFKMWIIKYQQKKQNKIPMYMIIKAKQWHMKIGFYFASL